VGGRSEGKLKLNKIGAGFGSPIWHPKFFLLLGVLSCARPGRQKIFLTFFQKPLDIPLPIWYNKVQPKEKEVKIMTHLSYIIVTLNNGMLYFENGGEFCKYVFKTNPSIKIEKLHTVNNVVTYMEVA
jgi:hypothetical protein